MTSKASGKQARERDAARLLRRCYRALKGYRFYSQPPPEPDIRAVRRCHRIGIEITEVHGNPKLRMTEAEQDRVLAASQKLWVAGARPMVGVIVSWRPTREARKYPDSLAGRLVEIVAARIPSDEPLTITDAELDAQLGAGGPIEAVHVYQGARATEWGAERSWEASPAGAAIIQREIARKDAKCANYQRSYAEKWLLLIHSPRPASGFDVDASVLHTRYQSTFDRVLLLRMAPLRANRLTVRKLRSRGHLTRAAAGVAPARELRGARNHR